MFWHRSFSPAERSFLMIGLLRLTDVGVVVSAGLFAFWLRNDIADLPAHYVLGIALGAFGIANVAQIAGLYDFRALSRPHGQFGRVVVAWAAVMTVLIVLAYFTKTSDSFSRLWAATWFMLVAGGLIVARVVALARIEYWRRTGRLKRRIAVIGQGRKADHIGALIADPLTRDASLVGTYDEARLPELLAAISREEVDEVIVALPGRELEAVKRVVRVLGGVSVEVSFAPDAVGLPFPVLDVSFIGGAPLFDLHRRPLSVWNRVVKRLEDLVLASLILILLSPLMVLIALLIRATSPGPALFRQQRHGFNNNTFTMYKFRTMRAETSARDADAARDIAQARRDDPRVTPIGRLLRRTSLDELPNLFNVLRGEMSLIGPRPHALAHNREYAEMLDGYLGRHRVKPGMTGWAQVNGLRGETDTLEKMRARVEHDLYYINHWSLWFDFKILVLTLVFGFLHRNAY